MKSYCLKCKKDIENINSKISRTSNNRTMILSKCAICRSKKSRFIKNKEAKGLLSNLGIRNERNSKQVLISRRQIYAQNAFKTTRIYLQCLWTIY